MKEPLLYDVLIIGGGVVGLSILHSLSTTTKKTCVLVESNPHLLMGASGRNTGIICTGVDAPLGSLERCLIRDSISQVRQFCNMMNIPMKECGSLVCTWPWDAGECSNTCTAITESNEKTPEDLLRKVAAESWDAGDVQVTVLDSATVQEMEPAISCQVKGAVYIPGEIVVDPWLFSIAFAVRARENGAIIHTNFEYDNERSFFDTSAETPRWMVYNRKNMDNNNNTTDMTDSLSNKQTLAPSLLQAKVIVNAAGINADAIQLNTFELPSPPFQMRPRRGQYIIFRQPPSIPLLMRPIQPIPTEHTKGIFVFSSIYNQLIFGPTASEQSSKTDVIIDPDVAERLMLHGKRVLCHSNVEPTEDHFCRTSPYYIGEYVGIRPATTHRDYQVHFYHKQQWITVAGIRSTGLTSSIGIGNYVARCIDYFGENQYNSQASSQFSILKTTPLPPLKVLVDEFHKSGEEECVIINCNKYRVTHPISVYGWRARTGFASVEE